MVPTSYTLLPRSQRGRREANQNTSVNERRFGQASSGRAGPVMVPWLDQGLERLVLQAQTPKDKPKQRPGTAARAGQASAVPRERGNMYATRDRVSLSRAVPQSWGPTVATYMQLSLKAPATFSLFWGLPRPCGPDSTCRPEREVHPQGEIQEDKAHDPSQKLALWTALLALRHPPPPVSHTVPTIRKAGPEMNDPFE